MQRARLREEFETTVFNRREMSRGKSYVQLIAAAPRCSPELSATSESVWVEAWARARVRLLKALPNSLRADRSPALIPVFTSPGYHMLPADNHMRHLD